MISELNCVTNLVCDESDNTPSCEFCVDKDHIHRIFSSSCRGDQRIVFKKAKEERSGNGQSGYLYISHKALF